MASGSLNSLSVQGGATLTGGETYISMRETVFGEAASLSVGSNASDGNYFFTSTIGTVTDQLKTTAPLVVETFARISP